MAGGFLCTDLPEHPRRRAADPAGVRPTLPADPAAVRRLRTERHHSDSFRLLLRAPDERNEHHLPRAD